MQTSTVENSFLRQTWIWPPIVYHSARYVHRGSYTCYMNAHVLLNLLNGLRKTIKFETCRAFYHLWNEINKFNKTGCYMTGEKPVS